MAKKRTVVPDFGAAPKAGKLRNAPVQVKGAPKDVRVKPKTASSKSGQRGR